MFEIIETENYSEWFGGLRDDRAQNRIALRLRRISLGNLGDFKHVGDGVNELRIDYGPGYRVYFIRQGAKLIMLLAGGDKSTQDRDIARARALARSI